MKKIDIRYLYDRTKKLLLQPETEWQIIDKEYNNVKDLFQAYVIPLSLIVSLIVLILSFFHYTAIQAICYAIINLLSTTTGIWLCYIIAREYLNNKIRNADNTALNLTVYSASVFVVFHSISVAFVSGFFSQLMSLISLIFIRTLYIGIKKNTDIPADQKTNMLIITILSIICIPVILKKILMIIFHIPVFNL